MTIFLKKTLINSNEAVLLGGDYTTNDLWVGSEYYVYSPKSSFMEEGGRGIVKHFTFDGKEIGED